MELIRVVLLLCTIGVALTHLSHSDDGDMFEGLESSMKREGHMGDYSPKREKRYAMYETTEDTVYKLLKDVIGLRTRISLLEKDNANFQQILAAIMTITDKKLAKFSCGCLKEMLHYEGVLPCELTRVVSVMPQSSVDIQATPSLDMLESSAAIYPDVQYLDSPVKKPLAPSIIAVSYYGDRFYRYLMDNGTLVKLHNERKVTHTLAFDRVEEKVIWSSFNPRAIYSAKLDGSEVTNLRSDVLSYGIAIDNDKRLLFVTTVSPRLGLAVMNVDGNEYKLIAHVAKYGRPSRISLDVKNEQTYVVFRSRILKINYNGSAQNVFLQARFVTALTFDSVNGVLYFADRITILKAKDMKGVKPKAERVIRFQPKSGSFPSDLAYHEGNLYFGFKFKQSIEVMTLENKTVTTLAMLDGDFISLCLTF